MQTNNSTVHANKQIKTMWRRTWIWGKMYSAHVGLWCHRRESLWVGWYHQLQPNDNYYKVVFVIVMHKRESLFHWHSTFWRSLRAFFCFNTDVHHSLKFLITKPIDESWKPPKIPGPLVQFRNEISLISFTHVQEPGKNSKCLKHSAKQNLMSTQLPKCDKSEMHSVCTEIQRKDIRIEQCKRNNHDSQMFDFELGFCHGYYWFSLSWRSQLMSEGLIAHYDMFYAKEDGERRIIIPLLLLTTPAASFSKYGCWCCEKKKSSNGYPARAHSEEYYPLLHRICRSVARPRKSRWALSACSKRRQACHHRPARLTDVTGPTLHKINECVQLCHARACCSAPWFYLQRGHACMASLPSSPIYAIFPLPLFFPSRYLPVLSLCVSVSRAVDLQCSLVRQFPWTMNLDLDRQVWCAGLCQEDVVDTMPTLLLCGGPR